MTEVVNVKVQHIRPRYNNLQDWMADPQNVYVGRRGVVFIDGTRFPPESSPFANPFKVDKSTTRDQAVEKYREYIVQKLANKELDLETLRGKTLGCWCKPDNCHGNVLVDLLSQKQSK